MLFSSLSFLYCFLPLVSLLYFLSKKRPWRNAVLLIFSLVFYSWGEPKYLLLMLFLSIAAWLCGLGIDKYRSVRRKSRFFFTLSVFLLLCSLLVFKYLNFFVENFIRFTGVSLPISKVALPIGISFYTFQILSYIIDLYHGKVSVQKNLFYFVLYVCFFPQLIAGPIVRYITVETEITCRNECLDDIIYGMRRFIIGLGKKILLANNVAVIAKTVYSAPGLSGTFALWLAALCYTLQIYFDFSGYSDMAIGLGRIFGFHFLENFNYPYAATSITDFWRRWHISLSSWFRDYVYIPLGGNRVVRSRWIFNIMLVWCLTGMWHGASWNFIIWGLYYGLLLLAEKLFLSGILERIPSFLRRIYTLFFVVIGWVIFDLTDLSQLTGVLKNMFVYSPTNWRGLLMLDTAICMDLAAIIPAIIFSFPILRKIQLKTATGSFSAATDIVCLGLLGICIMFLISTSYNPFIYFRF